MKRKVLAMSKSASTSASGPNIVKESNTRSKSLQNVKSEQHKNVLVRWLRSRTPVKKGQALPPTTETKTSVTKTDKNTRRHKKQKQHSKDSPVDDVSRINKRVRYHINRMNREQNLIDVYSTEGWKGSSLEKIRPEQELKRAKTQILQCKLAIRQALQQLDTLALEGSIQDSAFDSEGQINADDIFCAKCKSKEVFSENDIILCDGACNRAFHQFCLEPPLRTEDIPPGEEGWFCPVCDCKFECLDIINDHLATNYELEDSWEKIFAEAVLEASGNANLFEAEQDWPSEDSEDDDYNPMVGVEDEKAENLLRNDTQNSEEESSHSNEDDSESDSSDDSSEVSMFDEFAVTSGSTGREGVLSEDNGGADNISLEAAEDAVLVSGKRQRKALKLGEGSQKFLGARGDWPDEDSEDHDYNPEGENHEGAEKEETHDGHDSESDSCHSDEDDLEEDSSDDSSGVSVFDEFAGTSRSRGRKGVLLDENGGMEEISREHSKKSGEEDVVMVSGKRQRKELDYKQLYDDLYGENAVHKESSEDEDWGMEKRTRRSQDTDGVTEEYSSESKWGRVKNGEKSKLLQGTSEGSKVRKGPIRLPAEMVVKLKEVFKECQLPSKACKEDLSNKLGISFAQVNIWFRNARRAALRKGSLLKNPGEGQDCLCHNPNSELSYCASPKSGTVSGATKEPACETVQPCHVAVGDNTFPVENNT